MLTNQLLADLPPITFDSMEWVSYQTVGQNPASGWQLFSGNSIVSPEGSGFNGGKALLLPANTEQQTKISRALPWNPAEQTAFIDFMIKPAADPTGSLASVFVNGTQLAFQVPDESNSGEIWVYQGSDTAGSPSPVPKQWIKTVGAFEVTGTAATAYIRATLRHDYSRNIWDLFIDGKLAAANLSFEGRGVNLETLDFYGSSVGDTLIDDLSAASTNMLFPDADKDGLSDAWEIANGSNPNLYDRDAIKPGTGKSFLDLYLDSLWPQGPVNMSNGAAPSVGIPPLSILGSHQPVGAVKGSLSVGGDGSSNYSVPIDLPKGTAGMEPKLSLNYSSNSGNGIMGVGWSLGGLQRITRGPSSAVKDGAFDPMDFDASDRFFLDGERLVCVAGTYGADGSQYRTEMDSFARITAVGAGPQSWKIETKAGLIVTLGATADSRIAVTQGALAWGVNRVEDTLGNYYSVEYSGDAGTSNQRVAAMHYTGNTSQSLAPYCHVLFDYEARQDTAAAYSTYTGFTNDKRLSAIRVLTGNFANHSYKLNYESSYQSGRSFVTSITKFVTPPGAAAGAEPTLAVPLTQFHYDGITEGEALWRDPGTTSLPVYGIGLDASAAVNSTVVTPTTDDTRIDLSGDVARAFRLNTGDITVYSDTRIQFEFKSDKQVSGAIIGLDDDAIYQTNYTSAFCRIGGTGTILLSSGNNFPGAAEPYTVGEGWKTFNLPLGLNVTGLKKYLVLMCVDNSLTDGIDNAMFKNIRIYRSGSQQVENVEPIHFPSLIDVPRFYDVNGNDLGVFSVDFDADGLPDLSDWRATNYTEANGLLTPVTAGALYRNTGSGFVMETGMLPPVSAPLSCRSTDTNAFNYTKKHHFLAQPTDVNGDGKLDILASVNIQKSGSVIKNEYAFFSWNGTAWTNLTGWELPFQLVGTSTSQSNGTRRDEHFQWVDLNSDGYQDLVVYTTAQGRLFNSATAQILAGGGAQQQIAAGLASVAYINKGKNGPGWVRDESLYLPEPLLVDQKDVGRRVLDLDGDGVVEIAESANYDSPAIRHTYKRINADDTRLLEETLYLGSYEREIHSTKASAAASPVVTKTVHRHSIGGFATYTKTVAASGQIVRLSTILKDHLGSTDVILTGTWNGSSFDNPQTERQSFNPWGERRAAETQVTFRATDTDAFHTSTQDYDRGYTGHEQLDDSGLIHMNGRIYDPELGRMLSPDPVVQVPEFSQNFNRYSYVLNNPLNMSDPTGFSWLSKAFHKVGHWLSQNWRTVTTIVVAIVVGSISGGLASAWAVGMGFGTAASAAIGAGVGAFWGSLASSLLSGQKLGESLINALRSGVIAAAMMYTFVKGLEMAVKATNPFQEAELFKVNGKTGKWESVDLGTIKDGSLNGKVVVNGMNNDLTLAIRNGVMRVAPGEDFYVAYNPTNGGFNDFLECGLDKFAGQSEISRSTARILTKFNPQFTTIVAHSQGTMIANNALNILAQSQSINGYTVLSWGSAQNELGARLVMGSRGVSFGGYVNHPFDAVANVIGCNALTKPNPYRFAGSILASPLLFTNPYFSPHSNPEGGEFLKWTPWLYDTP